MSSDVLMIIETEGTVMAGCFHPTDPLKLIYSTITNWLIVRKLVGPEEPSDSEVDSDDFDFNNRYKPRSEIVYQQETSDIVRQIVWTEKFIYVAMRGQLELYRWQTNGSMVLHQSIKPSSQQNKISHIHVYEKTLYMGTETGDIHIFTFNKKDEKYNLVKTLDDAADYISDIYTDFNAFYVTSGDGSIYSYDPNTYTKIDNNATENFDFTAVQAFNNNIIVGTTDQRVLVFKQNYIALPQQSMKMNAEIEFIDKMQNGVLLVGLSNGELHGIMKYPLCDLGILCKVQNKPLVVHSLSCDESIGLYGGADNRIYIVNFGWMQEEENDRDKIEKAIGLNEVHNGLNNTQTTTQISNTIVTENDDYLEYLKRFEEEEEEEEDEKESTSIQSELTDSSSVNDNSSTNKNISKKSKKTQDSDSSFSEFFEFKEVKQNEKERQRSGSYGRSGRDAQKKEFFKDL